MKIIITLLILLASQIIHASELKASLSKTDLSPTQIESIINMMNTSYSKTIDYFEEQEIDHESNKFIPVWKKEVLKLENTTKSNTAFWLANDHFNENELIKLLRHPDPLIISQATDLVTQKNLISSIPPLIKLLENTVMTGGSIKTTIARDAEEALQKLTHTPNYKNIEAKLFWEKWYSLNRHKGQKTWKKEGSELILKMLRSDDIDTALYGFKFANKLGILKEEFPKTLQKFSGELEVNIIIDNEGKTHLKVTNNGTPCIVAFKRSRYSLRYEDGGYASSSSSPYFPNWYYSQILNKGDSLETEIRTSHEKKIISCTITDLIRNKNYKAKYKK